MRCHDWQSSILYNCLLLRHLGLINNNLNSIEYANEVKYKDTETLTWKNDQIILWNNINFQEILYFFKYKFSRKIMSILPLSVNKTEH